MPVAIRVENLSKKFIISHQGREQYVALRDVISRNVKKWSSYQLYAGDGNNGFRERKKEEFWALRDIFLR